MTRVVLAVVALSIATVAGAHHSPAIYDLQRTMRLVGSVVRYEWGNPHVYIHIRSVTDAGGVVWEIETGSPTMMERAGWSSDSLRVNEQVIVQVNPARNPARRAALLSSLQKADAAFSYQRGAPLGSALPPNPVAATSLAGNWLPATPAFLRFVGASGQWPLTDKARTALASHTDSKNGGQNCVSLSAPFLMAWPDLKQIEVRDDTTVLRSALIDNVEREIHMNASSHAGAERTNQGHSIGHFEGGVLVVDTAYLSAHASGIREGVPSGPGKHLIERFELSSDRTRLTYSYALEDPEYLAKPVTGSIDWVHRPDLQYTGYQCDRDIAGRFLAR